MRIPSIVRNFLPLLGALGFFALSELSLRGPGEFLIWSPVAFIWILLAFSLLAARRLKGRLVRIAIPAVAMIAISTVLSLLFLDLAVTRHGFIIFYALVLYLFYEHVRREIESPNPEDSASIAEFARMVNIGSLFLLATVGIGVTIFLSVKQAYTVLPFMLVSAFWSWHLFKACYSECGSPRMKTVVTTILLTESYIVALSLPTTMFVGGALVGIVYYLASNLMRSASDSRLPEHLLKRYAYVGGALILILLLTARWV